MGPFEAGDGQKWYAAKVLTYGLALIIGVILRLIMHEWQAMFRVLAQGPDAGVEAKLEKSIQLGRNVAYMYWILISGTCFFASVKNRSDERDTGGPLARLAPIRPGLAERPAPAPRPAGRQTA